MLTSPAEFVNRCDLLLVLLLLSKLCVFRANRTYKTIELKLLNVKFMWSTSQIKKSAIEDILSAQDAAMLSMVEWIGLA